MAGVIAEIADRYLKDKPRERASYAWKQLCNTFGHLRPDQVDRPLCRSYTTARLKDGASHGTIIKELSTLRAALRWHDKNTPATFEMPAAPPPKELHLTREQYRKFREASSKVPHMHLFAVLAYTTGGRAEAVLDLTWDRVDFASGVIRLGTGEHRQKGRATIPIHDSARFLLMLARKSATTDHVIEYGGKPIKKVRRAFARTAEEAGVPWCTPHVLRHTAAVHMVEAGVPLEEVAQYLGHSSVSVTYRVYARYSPTYLRRAGSALE